MAKSTKLYMPELPEVETIRQGLRSAIVGKRFSDFWTNWRKNVKPSAAVVKRKIKGQKVIAVERRAKILIIKLNGGLNLLIHLKLTGQLVYQLKTKDKKPKTIFGGHPQKGGLENLPNKFTHHIFTFSNGAKLFFNDLRKFGWVKLVDKEQVDKFTSGLGIEPFDKDFTLAKFTAVLKRYPNRKVKQVLLDQTLISGLGNIYADESLFAAGIRPSRQAKRIKPPEIRRLYQSVKKILKAAIKHKGTSTDTIYIQISGAPGGYGKYLKVYGRHKDKCKRCGSQLIKIKQNGRGTHYCPKCQK